MINTGPRRTAHAPTSDTPRHFPRSRGRHRTRPAGAGSRRGNRGSRIRRESAVAPRRRRGRHDVHGLPAPDRQVRRRASSRPARPSRSTRRSATRRRRATASSGSRRKPSHRQGDTTSSSSTTSRSRRRTSRPPRTRPSSTWRSSARNTEATRTISLERVEANLAVTQADRKGNAVPLKNDPPAHLLPDHPRASRPDRRAIPRSAPVEGASGLQRVVNTRSLILEDRRHLLHAARRPMAPRRGRDRALAARGLGAPAPVQAVRDAIAKDENQSQVGPARGSGRGRQGACSPRARSPEIIVSTVAGRAHRDERQAAR